MAITTASQAARSMSSWHGAQQSYTPDAWSNARALNPAVLDVASRQTLAAQIAALNTSLLMLHAYGLREFPQEVDEKLSVILMSLALDGMPTCVEELAKRHRCVEVARRVVKLAEDAAQPAPPSVPADPQWARSLLGGVV